MIYFIQIWHWIMVYYWWSNIVKIRTIKFEGI